MDNNSIIISDTLANLSFFTNKLYIVHAYCLSGECHIDRLPEGITLREGDLLIVPHRVLGGNMQHTDDFKVKVIYVENTMLEACNPPNNYAIAGTLSLYKNPVMSLNSEQRQRCLADISLLESRWTSEHHFKQNIVMATLQAMFLDFFNFHATLRGKSEATQQTAELMERLLAMLERGDYRKHRDIAYYADKLCVTGKYLSEASNKVSGMPASYWINRFAVMEIARLLRDRSFSFTQIADMFAFSSAAYFTRYVKDNLGMTPTEFRE